MRLSIFGDVTDSEACQAREGLAMSSLTGQRHKLQLENIGPHKFRIMDL